MQQQIKELKEFAKWFEVQAKADANDLIKERHATKLYALVDALEKADTENASKKEEIKNLIEAIHRIGFAIECVTVELHAINKYQALTLWEKIKRIFSWRKN